MSRGKTLRRIMTQTFHPDGRVTTTTRLETLEEAEARMKREADGATIKVALSSLTPSGSQIHEALQEMIGDLADAGVDVSYFPVPAELVLIRYADTLSKLYDQPQTDQDPS